MKVTALKFHTLHGEPHEADDTYDAPADLVPSLVAQGLVAAPDAPPVPAKPSQPVTPLTTDDFKGKPADATPPAPAVVPPVAPPARAPKPAKAAKVAKPAERRKVTKPLRKAKIRGKR